MGREQNWAINRILEAAKWNRFQFSFTFSISCASLVVSFFHIKLHPHYAISSWIRLIDLEIFSRKTPKWRWGKSLILRQKFEKLTSVVSFQLQPSKWLTLMLLHCITPNTQHHPRKKEKIGGNKKNHFH